MGAYRVCHDGASERAFRIEDERNMYLHTFFVRLSTIRYYYCLLLTYVLALLLRCLIMLIYIFDCLHILSLLLAGNIHNK